MLWLLAGGILLQAAPPTFNRMISNTATNKELNELKSQLKSQSVKLVCNQIKRDAKGRITSIHILLSTASGKVEGTYTHFSSIRIYETDAHELGIVPVSEDQK